MSTVRDRRRAPTPRPPEVRRPQARRPNPRRAPVVMLAVTLGGAGLVVTLALGIAGQSGSGLGGPGGLPTAGGRFAGLVAGYAVLIVVLLAARVPWIERAVGQPALIALHRRLAPWPLVLLVAHVALVVTGYAATARAGVPHQYWTFVRTFPGMLGATVGFLSLIVIGVASARFARRRMRYETWWALHLYTYLALALSFAHQIDVGTAFVGHPAARAWWTALWIGTGGVALVYRVLLPAWRTARHGLRVVAVTRVSATAVSVVCAGRDLDRLRVAGGQFLWWRILRPGLWWQAHPYSLSALPAGSRLRFTVRVDGDHALALTRLRPGTRLAIEGPYGAFTKYARFGNRVALIGAGVGVTPLVALLQDLPARVDAVVVTRAGHEDDLIHRDELRQLVEQRRGRLHELVGSRRRVAIDGRSLGRLIPDIAQRDVYVCGPEGFVVSIRRIAETLGVAPARVHSEPFAL